MDGSHGSIHGFVITNLPVDHLIMIFYIFSIKETPVVVEIPAFHRTSGPNPAAMAGSVLRSWWHGGALHRHFGAPTLLGRLGDGGSGDGLLGHPTTRVHWMLGTGMTGRTGDTFLIEHCRGLLKGT